jgi:acetolactate synthase-1/2/3 large subunit
MLLSDYVILEIKKHVKTIFMVTGGSAMYLNDSIGRLGMNYVCCHHEQACAMAAEAYARMTGSMGAICITSGPASLNALNGVAGAWTDSIPMIILSGQVRTQVQASGGLRLLAEQEADIKKIAQPVTKYIVMITDPRLIRYELEKALHIATHGRPGPVWLDIPLDIQRTKINPEKLKGFRPPKLRHVVSAELIKKVAQKLRAAKHPLLLVGNGVRLAHAESELQKLLARTKINAVVSVSGLGLVTKAYPYFLGLQGMAGGETANQAVGECDLLLILGTRMSIQQVSFDYEYFARQAYQIMVDIDPAELHKKTLSLNLPVAADIKDFLRALLKEPLLLHRWPVQVKPQRYKLPKKLASYEFFDHLDTKLPIVVGNGPSASVAAFKTLALKKNQRLIVNLGMGSMGHALPAAVGTCFAVDKKPVVCVDGEGSLMFNLQELETISYHKLPIKLFVMNNDGYLSISRTQLNYFGRIYGAGIKSGVGIPDMKKIAAAFNMRYFRIADRADLINVTRKALRSSGPVLCEIFTDSKEMPLGKWSPKKE